MRTTIDLRADLHKRAMSIARDRGETLSDTVNELLAVALDPPVRPVLRRSPVTGLTVAHIGRPITIEDVRSLEDDE
jgi:hypothetical protein